MFRRRSWIYLQNTPTHLGADLIFGEDSFAWWTVGDSVAPFRWLRDPCKSSSAWESTRGCEKSITVSRVHTCREIRRVRSLTIGVSCSSFLVATQDRHAGGWCFFIFYYSVSSRVSVRSEIPSIVIIGRFLFVYPREKGYTLGWDAWQVRGSTVIRVIPSLSVGYPHCLRTTTAFPNDCRSARIFLQIVSPMRRLSDVAIRRAVLSTVRRRFDRTPVKLDQWEGQQDAVQVRETRGGPMGREPRWTLLEAERRRNFVDSNGQTSIAEHFAKEFRRSWKKNQRFLDDFLDEHRTRGSARRSACANSRECIEDNANEDTRDPRRSFSSLTCERKERKEQLEKGRRWKEENGNRYERG